MIDHFSRLGVSRRPLLEPEGLKQRFHELTAGEHPDVAEDGGEFAELTVAHRVLADPRAALRHLLELEAPGISFRGVTAPEGVSAFFMEGGQRRQELDAFLKKQRAATSALARALLLPEQYELQERLEELLAKLVEERERWMERLEGLDARWTAGERPVEELAEVAQALGYLDKWSGQIREGLLTLQLLE